MSNKLSFDDNYDVGDVDGEYEPTDSEDALSDEEKELLNEVRERYKTKADEDEQQEVMAFDETDSDDGDDDDDDDDVDVDIDNKVVKNTKKPRKNTMKTEVMADSDIEGAENVDSDDDDDLNSNDWGYNKSNYYNTDFIDPDFSTYTDKERELAELEEEEAKAIQLRLANEMDEEDYLLDEIDLGKTTTAVDVDLVINKKDITHIKVKSDLSTINEHDKLILLREDAPELLDFIKHYENYMSEVESLLTPVLNYVNKHNVPVIPALEFAKNYRDIVLIYCSNIAFYLMLKVRGTMSLKAHPVNECLSKFKKLIHELKDKYLNIIQPQLEALLERIEDNDKFEVIEMKKPNAAVKKATNKTKHTRKLEIMEQYDVKKQKLNDDKTASNGDIKAATEMNNNDDDDDDEGEDEGEDEGDDDDDDDDEGVDENEMDGVVDATDDMRRGITYQMAKNKGLTPHRKKEQRNPRVKHRNKFRKALIRRKGAIRTVRTETKRYGGEISGIKATVSKSIKFK